MANLLFYDNPVALNKVDHKDTKIRRMPNHFKFAAKTNSVILSGIEFSEAAKEVVSAATNRGARTWSSTSNCNAGWMFARNTNGVDR